MVEYDKIVEADDSARAIEDMRGDVTFSEWKRIVADTINTGELSIQEKIDLFGPPVEAFCTDPYAVEVVNTTAVKGVPEEELRANVDYVIERDEVQTFNRAIGIHVTDMESANKILDKGIQKYNENIDGVDSIRHETVFFWIHSTDVDSMTYDHPDGVVVTAPADDVKVSSYMNQELLVGGYITADEYKNHHVLDYMDYVDNVGVDYQADEAHGKGTLF